AHQMPRFALEALAFGGLLLIVIYLLSGPRNLQGALPTLAAYAFAAYRLMPSLQQFYAMLVRLRFGGPALERLHADLVTVAPPAAVPRAASGPADDALPRQRPRPLGLARSLALEGVSYAYPGAGREAVQGISLEIDAN